MDKRRNRRRNEIMFAKQQKRQPHRTAYDIEIDMLKHLQDLGPSSVTELLYLARVNYSQAKRAILHLGQKHLIVSNPIDEFIIANGQVRGRYPTKLPPEIIGKLNRLSSNVKFIITITPLGEKYLAKMNELQNMVDWDKREE